MAHPHFTRVASTECYTDHRRYLPREQVPVRAASRAGVVDVSVRRSPDDTVVWQAHDVAIGDHAVPAEAWAAGCGWPVAFEIPVDPTWHAGLYLIDFDERGGGDGVASPGWFVVGEAPGSERPLLVLSDFR